MDGGIRLFRRQQDLCFVQSVLFYQFAYLPRQRGDFDNVLYPVVHIIVHSFAAQTDLYAAVWQGFQLQITLGVPLDADGALCFEPLPVVFAHTGRRMTQAGMTQCPFEAFAADVYGEYAFLPFVFQPSARAIHHP